MQYETIILELLSRIKALEADVNWLKETVSTLSAAQAELPDNGDSEAEEPAVPNKKVTEEMIDLCYEAGKKMLEGENPQVLADEIAFTTGMNRSSAIMYMYAAYEMLRGKIFKRSVSAKAIEKYFQHIIRDYGSYGLKKALEATRLYIQYRKDGGNKVDSVEKLCDTFEEQL